MVWKYFLILGVYDIETGHPLIGLVGSPFTETDQIIIGKIISNLLNSLSS